MLASKDLQDHKVHKGFKVISVVKAHKDPPALRGLQDYKEARVQQELKVQPDRQEPREVLVLKVALGHKGQ